MCEVGTRCDGVSEVVAHGVVVYGPSRGHAWIWVIGGLGGTLEAVSLVLRKMGWLWAGGDWSDS